MLNHGARVTTFEELMLSDYDPEKLLFIRPDDDGKSFAGEVLRFADCQEWLGRLKMAEDTGISGDSRIIIGEPFHIGREWRLWCVAFSEARCLQFTPHDIFVMDICETGGDLYIVECNCMNAAGFYDADVQNIITNVSNHFAHFPAGPFQ